MKIDSIIINAGFLNNVEAATCVRSKAFCRRRAEGRKGILWFCFLFPHFSCIFVPLDILKEIEAGIAPQVVEMKSNKQLLFQPSDSNNGCYDSKQKNSSQQVSLSRLITTDQELRCQYYLLRLHCLPSPQQGPLHIHQNSQ
jgi:hypothetical protein